MPKSSIDGPVTFTRKARSTTPRSRFPELQRAQKLGQDIDKVQGTGWTVLHHAVYDGKADLVRALLEAGADANRACQNPQWPQKSSDSTGDRPVHLALSANVPEIMAILIEHGADLSLPNAKGEDLAAFAATCDPSLHALAQSAQVQWEQRVLRSTLDSPKKSVPMNIPRKRL